MFDELSKFVTDLFENPLRASVTAALIFLIYLYLNKRKENEKLRSTLNEEKQKFYHEIFVFLGRVLRGKADITEDDEMDKLIELDARLKLYANNNVVKAWADFWHILFKNFKDEQVSNKDFLPVLEAYGIFQHSIRKDLRSSGAFSDLKWYDFSRSTINDLDDHLPEVDRKFRSLAMRKYNTDLDSRHSEQGQKE